MNAQSLFQRVAFSILCCLGFGASAASVDCNFLAVSNAVATGGVHTLACGGTIVFPQILSVSPGTTALLTAKKLQSTGAALAPMPRQHRIAQETR